MPMNVTQQALNNFQRRLMPLHEPSNVQRSNMKRMVQ